MTGQKHIKITHRVAGGNEMGMLTDEDGF